MPTITMNETTQAQVTETVTTLETETCTRCGGSGKYSWCQMHGDKCFKCGGKGKHLTKRGAAAAAYLTEIRSKRVDALVAGDVVFCPGGGPFPSRWITVVSLSPTDTSGWRSTVNGVEQPVRQDLITINGADGGSGWIGHAPEKMIRIKQTAEQAAETFARALAYQATLTKAGTPRKR